MSATGSTPGSPGRKVGEKNSPGPDRERGTPRVGPARRDRSRDGPHVAPAPQYRNISNVHGGVEISHWIGGSTESNPRPQDRSTERLRGDTGRGGNAAGSSRGGNAAGSSRGAAESPTSQGARAAQPSFSDSASMEVSYDLIDNLINLAKIGLANSDDFMDVFGGYHTNPQVPERIRARADRYLADGNAERSMRLRAVMASLERRDPISAVSPEWRPYFSRLAAQARRRRQTQMQQQARGRAGQQAAPHPTPGYADVGNTTLAQAPGLSTTLAQNQDPEGSEQLFFPGRLPLPPQSLPAAQAGGPRKSIFPNLPDPPSQRPRPRPPPPNAGGGRRSPARANDSASLGSGNRTEKASTR